MPVLSGSVSVAANAVSANVLSGELYEFLPFPALITVYLTGSAAGLKVTFSVGGAILTEEADINANNRVPIVPDDQFLQEGGLGGERLFLRFRNTTAGALTARWIVRLDGVGR